jgi:uncharacterized protein YacL
VSKALFAILCVLFVLILGDCVSTYLCLTTPSPEYNVWEANPVSEWLFQAIGLVPGLVIFALAKAIALLIVWKWAHVSPGHMLLFLILMGGSIPVTAYVNYNNFHIYYLLVNYVPS